MKMNKFVTVFFAAVLALSFAGWKKNQNSKTIEIPSKKATFLAKSLAKSRVF